MKHLTTIYNVDLKKSPFTTTEIAKAIKEDILIDVKASSYLKDNTLISAVKIVPFNGNYSLIISYYVDVYYYDSNAYSLLDSIISYNSCYNVNTFGGKMI